MTKEEAQNLLLNDETISIGTLYALQCHPSDSIYVNCYPDCNCSQDTYRNFDEFWEIWGNKFKDSGYHDI